MVESALWPTLAQTKKVTVLGSSTAFGTGASPIDSGWVGKLRAYFNQNSADGLDTLVDNRALGGYTTYHSMPTGYFVPDRPTPDPLRNVTFVLNDPVKPDIVIINYPTNDIANYYTPKEMMDNLRLMSNELKAKGITTYITTTQPRNSVDPPQRTLLRQLVDSIQNNFGLLSINFWDDLVTNDGQNMIRPELAEPDGTHVNNLGHQLLFERVQAKNIFGLTGNAPLPLTLKNWQVSVENSGVKLNWNTTTEDPGTLFEIQRSSNGTIFQTLAIIKGTGGDANYSWTDISPLSGKSFYRLKILESSKQIYSRIVSIVNDQSQLISSFYVDGSQIHLQFNKNRSQSASLSIISYSGAIVKKRTVSTGTNSVITVPVSDLPSGNYFLKIITSDGLTSVERFTILK
jgi:lysophospholipase L1-like esterase